MLKRVADDTKPLEKEKGKSIRYHIVDTGTGAYREFKRRCLTLSRNASTRIVSSAPYKHKV
jgi:hypothetical protein